MYGQVCSILLPSPDGEASISSVRQARTSVRIKVKRQGAPSERGDAVVTYGEPIKSRSNVAFWILGKRERSNTAYGGLDKRETQLG